MTTNNKNGAARKAIIEFLIIVVGVLTALAADEWRQDRERDNLERELLEDVRKEFSANLEQIDRVSEYFEDLRASHLSLSELSANEFEAMTEESARQLVLDIHRSRPLLNARTGVLRSVIDGGQLTSISDRRLRYAIAEWPTFLENAHALEIHEFNFFLEDWVPAYEAITDLGVDPRQYTPSMRRIAGKQAFFIGGYLSSLGRLREKTEGILSQLTEFETGR